jgi:hypothetical protein
VSGVGHQCHGIGEHAVGEFRGNENQVQADADGEGHAEACGSVHMHSPLKMIMTMHVSAWIGAVCAHRGHEDQRDARRRYLLNSWMLRHWRSDCREIISD